MKAKHSGETSPAGSPSHICCDKLNTSLCAQGLGSLTLCGVVTEVARGYRVPQVRVVLPGRPFHCLVVFLCMIQVLYKYLAYNVNKTWENSLCLCIFHNQKSLHVYMVNSASVVLIINKLIFVSSTVSVGQYIVHNNMFTYSADIYMYIKCSVH